ncbi:glycosidase [Fontibacillus phaseoli]|uniref:Glycosidase n=1 Tax=Fontibacillus phaseoli TaxID=1416533 RepID=A0A369BA11_9BACL|nr:alpha-amylase family glycosyl hydrolase [Fontibacillus phaseoli]RCX18155.1 glycosidase [Fontibacillus phaseoli]
MHKRLKGWFSRLLIFVLVVGSFGSFLTHARADDPTLDSGGLASPVIGERSATGAQVTFNYQGTGQEQKAIVKGDFYNNWEEIPLTLAEGNVWTLTRGIDAGWYQYGMDVDGWMGDPLNSEKYSDTNNNPGLSVPGIKFIKSPPSEIGLGESTVIDAVYFTGDRDTKDLVQLTLTKGLNGVSFDSTTGKLTVAANADTGNIEIEAKHDPWKIVKTVKVTENALKSPVINNDGTVTFNIPQDKLPSGVTAAHLVGQMNGWNEKTAEALILKDGVYSLTIPLSAGIYEYKFIPKQGSWSGDFLDPLNPRKSGGNPPNSLAIVPGIVIESDENVAIGGELELEASLLDAEGNYTDVTPTWSLKNPVPGVAIHQNILTVEPGTALGQVTIIASYDTYTTETMVNMVDNLNAYTINYYRFDGTANQWNLYMFPVTPDVGKSKRGKLNETPEGYAKATYYFPYKQIGVIPRLSTSEGEWADKDVEQTVRIKEGKNVVVWIVQGISEVFYEKPDLEKLEAEKYRRVQFTYVKDGADFSDWSVWTWYTGYVNKDFSFAGGEIDGNKSTVIIPITSEVGKIGFKIHKRVGSDGWALIDQDYDREIQTGSEVLTKVVVDAGKGAFRTLPGTTAPFLEDRSATFYYRDFGLFKMNKMDKIESVKLKINGNEYPMDYSREDERFTYTLRNLEEGTFEYSYLVTKDGVTEEVLDPKNTVDGKSQITYKQLFPAIQSETMPAEISFNENSVLSLNLAGIEDHEIRSIFADLSALGGKTETVIDNDLQALTIAVKDSVPTGVKKISVTLVDVYGNKYTHDAAVTVKPRQSVGKDDFDWDEARIYFMLTDRFLNGDTGNDDPNGENYDLSHAETYHGGDFKGVTEKIGYLKDLGINTIWITPIVDNIDFNKGIDFNSNQYAYHGYWAKDFTEIDEHLGDLEDFQKLLDTAHDNGIKVMVDVVLNHTGYGMDQLSPNWGDLNNLPTQPEREVFAGMLRDADEDPIIKNRVAGLPDFKTEDPAVREQIIKWQSDWIEKSKTASGNTIDYFRVDTIKHVENATWMAFKNQMTEINPAFKMIGENFGASVDNDGGYLRTGTMDSELDFAFKGIAKEFVEGEIESAEQKLQDRNGKIDNAAMLGQFLSSHDENGFMVSLLSGGDRQKFEDGTLDAEALKGLQAQHKIAASLQITAKGQPVIYYGEEVGQSGMNAGNMSNGEFSENRYDFNWDGLSDPTYSHIYEHYKKMLHIRDSYSKIFSKGTRAQIGGSDQDGYDVFTRTYQGKSVVVGINTKTTEQQISFTVPGYKNTKWVEQYGNQTVQADSDGKVTLTLPSSLDGGTIVLAAVSSPVTPPGTSNPNSGSAGSSSSGTGTPTPAISESVKVTAKASENGRKTAEVSATELEKAIAVAVNSGKAVTIQVSGVAAGEAAELVIPGSAVEKALEQKAALQLVFPDVTIEMPAGSIPAVAIHANGKIVFSKEVPSSEATKKLKSEIVEKDRAYSPAGDIYDFKLLSVGSDKQAVEVKPGTKVKITLTLDEAALKGIGDKNKAGVYAVNEDGSVVYVGGKWDGNSITFLSDRLASFVVMEYNKTFSDVTSGWAKEYVELLAAKHIASGVDADRFNPKGNVTRGEFAAFLGRTMGLNAEGRISNLSDVAQDSYYAGYVAELNELGIVTGYEDGTFRSNQTITREQMATILMKAYAHVTGQTASEVAGAEEAGFSDLGEASAYAVDSIKAAKALGIINGMGQNVFEPAATSTREQVAAVLILFMEKAAM